MAGEELFITSSAVSHQIKNLEDELGRRLFDRNSRELSLTGDGRSLYEEISPLIDRLDAAVADCKGSAAGRPIRISVQPFFASEFFVPRLGDFTAENRDIDIRVSASDESSENHPADADLSVRLFRAPPPGVDSRLLFPLRLVPAGSKALANSLRVRDGRIASEFPVIVHETYPKAWQQRSKASGIAFPKDSKVTRLDTMIAVVRAVEQGIGAALVPVPVADQWFRQKTIFRLFEHELVAEVSYYLIWQEDRAAAEGLARLRDWILADFSAGP